MKAAVIHHPPSDNLPQRQSLPSGVDDHALDGSLTPRRAELFRQVLARRTDRLVVVLDHCDDTHNAAAVLRTCDAFGIAQLHVVNDESRFRISRRISRGAHHYVEMHRHRTFDQVAELLRSQRFAIAVSDLSPDAVVGPQQLAGHLKQGPLAIVFGHESSGVSEAARSAADAMFYIPMVGLTQSLNLSVAVAVTLYSLRGEAITDDLSGDLSEERQTELFEQWGR